MRRIERQMGGLSETGIRPIQRRRLEFIREREGVPEDDGKLASECLGYLARPIYDALHMELRREAVLHGDETTLPVLRESGKAVTSKFYSGACRRSFNLDKSRSQGVIWFNYLNRLC